MTSTFGSSACGFVPAAAASDIVIRMRPTPSAGIGDFVTIVSMMSFLSFRAGASVNFILIAAQPSKHF
jgi:hypothetical protein